MAGKQILPAVVKYSRSLADTVVAVKEAGADASVQAEMLNTVSTKLAEVKAAYGKLKQATAEAAAVADVKAQAFFYKDVVKEAMAELRTPVDELEMIVDKDVWPMPTYGELTFEV